MLKLYPSRIVRRADPPPSEQECARREQLMRQASERTAAKIAALRLQDAAEATKH